MRNLMKWGLGSAVILSAFISQSALAQCKVSDISIKSFDAKFAKAECDGPICTYLNGIAVIENKCAMPVGVQVQIIAYDKNNKPLDVNEYWPASTRNIPPGEFTFSVKHWLDYDPAIHSINLKLIHVKRWAER